MFCVNCGQKIELENINFCPNCGSKIIHKNVENTEVPLHEKDEQEPSSDVLLDMFKKRIIKKSISEPLIEIQWENRGAWNEDIYHLFCAHIGRATQYGDDLYITGQTHMEPDMEEAFCRYYQIENPIMIFKYGMSRNSIEGFVMDCGKFVYYESEREGIIPLSEIENVVYAKRLLAPVMFFRLRGGEISDDIYLTGIQKVEEFVVRFRRFIFELNNIVQEEKVINLPEEENISDEHTMKDSEHEEINQVLSRICFDNRFRSEYCEIGNPISLRSNRMAQAMEYFDIDSSVSTYLIYDSSTSGKTCKEGFALCTDGFHFRYERQTGIIPWNYFGEITIKKFLNCVNVDGMTFATAFEAKKLLAILWEVQNYMKETLN